MRTIGVITVARSDYGIYRPILRKIQDSPDLKLYLIVTGMHLSPEFGMTVQEIEDDGFTINDRVEMLLSSDSPEGIGKSIGLGVIGFAQLFAHFRPDILLVLGDRFEMLTGVLAALPHKIPIAHLHGGETTEGAIDEAIRHSITKMSHLHFVSTETYKQRVIQLGEAPWRVTVSGAPGLDNLSSIDFLSRHQLEVKLNLSLAQPPLLVTYHPVTLEYETTAEQIQNVLTALEQVNLPVVFTYPNADTNGRIIIEAIEQYVQSHSNSRAVQSLGTQAYFSLMKHAAAMVGNSSSGIIEAASFALPVVNIGNRQRGRVRGENVIDVGCKANEIVGGIRQAQSPKFRQRIANIINPYGTGNAASIIINQLESVMIDQDLIQKQFNNSSLLEQGG